MKKVLMILAVMLMATNVWSAGSVTVAREDADFLSQQGEKITITHTTDSSGDVDGCTLCNIDINGYIYMVVYIFGDNAAGVDITLDDSDGKDVMSTDDSSPQLTDLAASDQQFMPHIGGATVSRYVHGAIDFVLGDGGATKTGATHIYVIRNKYQ